MNCDYFVFSSEGVDFFQTEKEARDEVEALIDLYRKEADYDGEWSGEVESICWGKVIGRATEVKHSDECYDFVPMHVAKPNRLIVEDIGNNDGIMGANAELGLSMDQLMKLVNLVQDAIDQKTTNL